jgi:hypothetical protein
LQQPASLDDAVIFAHAYEQCNASHDVVVSQPTRFLSRFTGRSTAPPPSAATGPHRQLHQALSMRLRPAPSTSPCRRLLNAERMENASSAMSCLHRVTGNTASIRSSSRWWMTMRRTTPHRLIWICIRSYYLNMDMGVAGYVYPVRLG